MVLVRIISRTKTIDEKYEYFIVQTAVAPAVEVLVLVFCYNFLELLNRYFLLFNRDVILNELQDLITA